MTQTAGPHRIVILGGGVTGLTVARALSQRRSSEVVLLEKEPAVGGLAATFQHNNFSFDYGSHRLHENCDPAVKELLEELCGAEMLRRERRGLLCLRDRVIAYPPTAFDILTAFGAGDLMRFSADFVSASVGRLLGARTPQDFERYTVQRVGRRLYERFYKPYAEKLYGTPPCGLSRDPAESRVRKFDLRSLYAEFRKTIRREQKTYLYPTQGIGQIANTLATQFQQNGGRLQFIAGIDRIHIEQDRHIRSVEITTAEGRTKTLDADIVIATIPLDVLHRLVRLHAEPDGPPSFDLRWRSLRLLFLITPDKRPSTHETYYFPEPHVPFGRVSELGKYSPTLNQDAKRTALTLEFPCSEGDAIWTSSDDELAARSIKELQRFQILRSPAEGKTDFFSRKLKNVYPVYDLGWHERFERVYRRLDSLENLYVIGRTALFLHCNIDHCLSMALKLVKHLTDTPNKSPWNATMRTFFDYRVRE